MRLAVISFTKEGNRWNERLTKGFLEQGETAAGYILEWFRNPYYEQAGLIPVKGSLQEWTGKRFKDVDGLIFIGAAGIAVRLAAPYIKDKLTDPAVVVMDEGGRFAISLLSGHVGGANDLALEAARITGAVPVITTATDVRHRFAVDVFAKAQELELTDREMAKRISADVLEGRPVGFFSDYPVEGAIPEGFTQEETCDRSLWITVKRRMEKDSPLRIFLPEESHVLRLVPRTLVLGIGCRKGTGKDVIQRQAEAVLEAANLDPAGVVAVATIDIKKEEQGLVSFTREMGAQFCTYGAEELNRVPGTYEESVFVAEITGVGNVCERAAMAAAGAAGGGRLLVKKQAACGVTIAVAEQDRKIRI